MKEYKLKINGGYDFVVIAPHFEADMRVRLMELAGILLLATAVVLYVNIRLSKKYLNELISPQINNTKEKDEMEAE